MAGRHIVYLEQILATYRSCYKTKYKIDVGNDCCTNIGFFQGEAIIFRIHLMNPRNLTWHHHVNRWFFKENLISWDFCRLFLRKISIPCLVLLVKNCKMVWYFKKSSYIKSITNSKGTRKFDGTRIPMFSRSSKE